MNHNPETCPSCRYVRSRDPNYDAEELGRRSKEAEKLMRMSNAQLERLMDEQDAERERQS